MRYVFLSLNQISSCKYYEDKMATRNEPLRYLFYYLDGGQRDEWLEESDNENDPNKVILWSRKKIKEALTPEHFNAHQDCTRLKDFWAYVDRYHKYSRKRLKEMPAIRISRQNYEQLKQQIETLYQRRPQYLILREHDDGHVDMLEQNELSPEDIKNMNREHKIYQNYKKRLEAYQKAHPNRSYVWRSPEDNEFESDFALYDPSDEQGVD